jgi:histidinol-phosphate aminotransferase
LLAACTEHTKLIFLCSPNNPTGSLVEEADVRAIAESRRGKSLVVIDEAYVEFSGNGSMSRLVGDFDNLVVLRTLSKAHGLAGARCGVAIACEDLISVMGRVLPPYTFPTPVIETVLAALEDDRVVRSAAAIADIIGERQRLFESLGELGVVETAWPSAANFILVRFRDLPTTRDYLQSRNILIRDFSNYPALGNCARITIGTAAENDALLQALEASEELSP